MGYDVKYEGGRSRVQCDGECLRYPSHDLSHEG
jgi:hypothetical protein